MYLLGKWGSAPSVCSSLQPASDSPQKQRESAIELMEQTGDFTEHECILVICLFTSSIDVADSYLVIKDKNIHKMFITHSLHLNNLS